MEIGERKSGDRIRSTGSLLWRCIHSLEAFLAGQVRTQEFSAEIHSLLADSWRKDMPPSLSETIAELQLEVGPYQPSSASREEWSEQLLDERRLRERCREILPKLYEQAGSFRDSIETRLASVFWRCAHLLEAFVAGEMEAPEFAGAIDGLFADCWPEDMPASLSDTLKKLHLSVALYQPNPELRQEMPEYLLDEHGLRERCLEILPKLYEEAGSYR